MFRRYGIDRACDYRSCIRAAERNNSESVYREGNKSCEYHVEYRLSVNAYHRFPSSEPAFRANPDKRVAQGGGDCRVGKVT